MRSGFFRAIDRFEPCEVCAADDTARGGRPFVLRRWSYRSRWRRGGSVKRDRGAPGGRISRYVTCPEVQPLKTSAPKELYDPNGCRVRVADVADRFVPLLRSVVRYDAAVLARCITAARSRLQGAELDYQFPALILLHQLIEALDAVAELASGGRSTAAVLPLRSAFEASAKLEYLIADFEVRAKWYLVERLMESRSDIEFAVSRTPRSKHVKALRARDRWFSQLPLRGTASAKDEYDFLSRFIERPDLKSTAAAIHRARARRRGAEPSDPPVWPDSFEKLCLALGRTMYYEFLYRQWSRNAHASEFGAILRGGVEPFLLRRIPNERNTAQVINFAVHFGLTAGKGMRLHYFGERTAHDRWYKEKIRASFIDLAKIGKIPPSK